MTAEVQLRTLAMADPVLQSYFGYPLFRYFDRQLQPGYITQGTCVRVLRVSTLQSYAQAGRIDPSQPRFQFDVLDYDAERARAACAAIQTWLETINLVTGEMFASPATTPKQHPNFVLNQRAGMDFQIQPPAYVETLDVRLFVVE